LDGRLQLRFEQREVFFLLLEEILKLGEGVFILAKLSKAASGLSRSDSLSPRTSVATTCPANLIASPTMRSAVTSGAPLASAER
jgi:hypothetical protein